MAWQNTLALLLLALAQAGGAPAAPLPATPLAVRVIDGDTLQAEGTRVRLFGIDAPERDQTCTTAQGTTWACGAWSTARLAALTRGRKATCEDLGADRYGRRLARCTVDGRDLAAEMVAEGAATAYRRYAPDYIGHETSARAAARGIWSAGPQTSPEAHRLATRAPDPAPAATGCAIKGNIGPNGRVYHLPGQRDYTATRISAAKGERWFCTAAEAAAAGFRPALR